MTAVLAPEGSASFDKGVINMDGLRRTSQTGEIYLLPPRKGTKEESCLAAVVSTEDTIATIVPVHLPPYDKLAAYDRPEDAQADVVIEAGPQSPFGPHPAEGRAIVQASVRAKVSRKVLKERVARLDESDLSRIRDADKTTSSQGLQLSADWQQRVQNLTRGQT